MTGKAKATKSQFPGIYLLTGYYSKNNPVSKLAPLVNTVVFTEDPESASSENGKPVVLRSDKNGQLNTLKGDGSLDVRQLFHAHKDRPIIIPPSDAISYLASAKGTAWAEEMVKMVSTFKPGEAAQTLKLQSVPFENLRRPKSVIGDKDADRSYRAWYDKLKPGSKIKAFVLAKTRALMVTINKSVEINTDAPLKITMPNGSYKVQEWPEQHDANINIAFLFGTKNSLPEGLYKFSIPLKQEVIDASKSRWNSNIVKTNDMGEPIYELAEMVRFDIKNPAGEFDIVNCDPISVEESLITQYPRFYSHLLDQAKSLPQKHEVKNVSGNTYEKGDKASISASSKAPAKGFVDYCTSWSVMKGKSQLAANLIATDIETYDKDGEQYNGKHNLAWKIGKALHESLEKDPKVKATLDSVFATKEGVDAWKGFREARKDYLEAISGDGLKPWKEALKEEYFKMPQNSADDLAKYEKTISGKIGLPKAGLDLFGKAINIVDFGTSAHALGKDGFLYFNNVLPELSKAKHNYKYVAQDYFHTLKKVEVKQSVELSGEFDFDQAVVNDGFRSQVVQQCQLILEAMEKHPDQKVSVAGHTCDIGGFEYNQRLSEDRAQAVVDVLIDAGVDQSRVEAQGFAYSDPKAPNDSDINRAKNRRVEIKSYVLATSDVSASREGIGSLERYRNLTVQQTLGKQDKELAMASQATDIALGIMSVIPATAPIAAGIALAKASTGAVISLGAAIDEVFMDNTLSMFLLDQKKQHLMTRESVANQSLIDDLYDGIDDKGGASSEIQWAAQFRVRAEAIAGLVGLMMRAASSSDSEGGETYEQRLKKYYIDAYIENFILNDEWVYPLNELSILRLDTYWLYAINQMERESDVLGPSGGLLSFGLSDNNRLASPQERAKIKTLATQKLKTAEPAAVGGAGHYGGGYMMAYPPQSSMRDHLTTQYQKYFPIHHFGSDNITEFGETFNPVFSNYSKTNYLHTEIFYKENNRWISFAETSKRVRVGRVVKNKPHKITPFTPIKVLIVFDKNMAAIAPLSFQVNRVDSFDVEGPIYKELAKELTKVDLNALPESVHQHEGKVGCVFHPFYQLWDRTYLGLKPMAGSTRLGFFSSAQSYYDWGYMDDMRFQITCQVGENKSTKSEIPLRSNLDSNGNAILETHFNTIPVGLDIAKRPEEQSLLKKYFLESRSKDFDYPPLYKGDKRVRIAIRVGKDSPYVVPAMNSQGHIFQNEIDAGNQYGLEANAAKVVVNTFDWNTPVEFIFVVSCTKLETKNYQKESNNFYDWKSIPCDVDLYEDATLSDTFTSDTQGPKLSKKLIYLGKASRTKSMSSQYSFDESQSAKDKDLDLTPIYETLKKADHQSLALLGWEKGIDYKDTERYVFAAHFKCEYETCRGVKVDSIRPFGKGVLENDGSVDEFVQYFFKNFSTAGDSGFPKNNGDTLSNHGGVDYQLHLNISNFFDKSMPWYKKKSAEDLAQLKEKLREEMYERLSSADPGRDYLLKWMEDDAKALKFDIVSAFKS